MLQSSIIITGAPIEETAKNQKVVNSVLKKILQAHQTETVLVQGTTTRNKTTTLHIPAYGIPSMVWTELKNTYPHRQICPVLPHEMVNDTFMSPKAPLKHYNIETSTMKTKQIIKNFAKTSVEKYGRFSNGAPSSNWIIEIT